MTNVRPEFKKRVHDYLDSNPPVHKDTNCGGEMILCIRDGSQIEQRPIDDLGWVIPVRPSSSIGKADWKGNDEAWVQCEACGQKLDIATVYGSLASEVKLLLQIQ